jgi:hypothetical protein
MTGPCQQFDLAMTGAGGLVSRGVVVSWGTVMVRIALLTFAIWISLSFLVLLMVARVGMHMHMPRSPVKPRGLRTQHPAKDLSDRF